MIVSTQPATAIAVPNDAVRAQQRQRVHYKPARVAVKWLSPIEAAVHCGFSVKSLEAWRREGRGPRYSRVGRNIKYSVMELDAWMEAQQVPTSDAAATDRVLSGTLQ